MKQFKDISKADYKNNEHEISKENNVLENEKFDILIIGGGITGLTTAYLLKDSYTHLRRRRCDRWS